MYSMEALISTYLTTHTKSVNILDEGKNNINKWCVRSDDKTRYHGRAGSVLHRDTGHHADLSNYHFFKF